MIGWTMPQYVQPCLSPVRVSAFRDQSDAWLHVNGLRERKAMNQQKLSLIASVIRVFSS